MAAPDRTWKLTLAYDGSDYAGWQVQPRRPTVQGALERALGRIEGKPVRVVGSGRTDVGVHALGQVASCQLSIPIPAGGLLKALNRVLPRSIRANAAVPVAEGFHARHHAVAKTYEYRIQRASACSPFEARYVLWHPYPLVEGAMAAAAPQLEGTHDFRSFASNSKQPVEHTRRTVFSSSLKREGSVLVYRVRGSGFLYRMVRTIVGTLMEVGRGNLAPNEIGHIIGALDRGAAGPAVPGRGLFLVSVEYDAARRDAGTGQRRPGAARSVHP